MRTSACIGRPPISGESDDSETELGFGGGIVIPNASGEFYLGIDIIDEMIFGGGFRYFLQ